MRQGAVYVCVCMCTCRVWEWRYVKSQQQTSESILKFASHKLCKVHTRKFLTCCEEKTIYFCTSTHIRSPHPLILTSFANRWHNHKHTHNCSKFFLSMLLLVSLSFPLYFQSHCHCHCYYTFVKCQVTHLHLAQLKIDLSQCYLFSAGNECQSKWALSIAHGSY